MTAVALGGLVGSLLWTWRPAAPGRSSLVVMVMLVGVGIPLVLAGWSSSLPLTAVLFGASGWCLGPFLGALFTARQGHAPQEVRAQVFTIGAGLKTTASAAGAAIAGVLAGLPTPTQLLLVGGSPILAGGLGALALGLFARRKPVAWRKPVARREPAPPHPSAHWGAS